MPHRAADAAFHGDGHMIEARISGDAVDFFQRGHRHAVGGRGTLPSAAVPEKETVGADLGRDQLEALLLVADLADEKLDLVAEFGADGRGDFGHARVGIDGIDAEETHIRFFVEKSSCRHLLLDITATKCGADIARGALILRRA